MNYLRVNLLLFTTMGSTKKHIHTDEYNELADLFKALGHPARLAIIDNLIEQKDINCKSLQSSIQLAQSTISKHIKVLHTVGILSVRVEANSAFYEVCNIAVKRIECYVNDLCSRIFDSDLDRSCLYVKPNIWAIKPTKKLDNS